MAFQPSYSPQRCVLLYGLPRIACRVVGCAFFHRHPPFVTPLPIHTNPPLLLSPTNSFHRALSRSGLIWSRFDPLESVPPGPNTAISGSPDPVRISNARAFAARSRECVRACQTQARSSAAALNSTPGVEEAVLKVVRDMDALYAAQGDLRVSEYRLFLALRGLFLPLEMQEKEEAVARAEPAHSLAPRRELPPSTALPYPTLSTIPPVSPPHPVVSHLSTLVGTAPVVSFAGQSFSIHPPNSDGVAACGLDEQTTKDVLEVVAHLEKHGSPGLASLKSLSESEDFVSPRDNRTGRLSSLATSIGSRLVMFFLSGREVTSLEAEPLQFSAMPQLGMPEEWVPPPPIHILVAGMGSQAVPMLLLPSNSSSHITLDFLLEQLVSSHTDIFLFLLNVFLTHFTRPPTHHTPLYPLVFHFFKAAYCSDRRLRAPLPYPLILYAHSPCN